MLAGAEALGIFQRHAAIGRRFARLDAERVAQMIEQLIRPAEAQLIERQTHSRHRPCGLSCLK